MIKPCLFLLISLIAWIYIGQSAVPINEFVVNSFHCEKDLPLLDCGGRVQRKNKTSQQVTGFILLKVPMDSNASLLAELFYQDFTGVWKGLNKKTFDKTCSLGDRFKDQKNRFVPKMNDGCPRKPGNYTIGPAFINRYRKDWEIDMKFWIPPFFLEEDNWKVVATYFYKSEPEKVIGKLTFEFRLLNERMSQ